MKCLHCQSEDLIKSGKNAGGSQRHACKSCGRYSSFERTLRGDAKRRALGLQLVFEGLSFRAAARVVGVHHQSVINWVNAAHREMEQQQQQQQQQQPEKANVAILEVDEQWTYVNKKKTKSSCSLRSHA